MKENGSAAGEQRGVTWRERSVSADDTAKGHKTQRVWATRARSLTCLMRKSDEKKPLHITYEDGRPASQLNGMNPTIILYLKS